MNRKQCIVDIVSMTSLIMPNLLKTSQFNVHTSETPNLYYQEGTLDVFSAILICNENEMRGYTFPRLQYTLPKLQMLGSLDIRCTNPLYGFDKWHSYQQQYPRPIMQLHSIFLPQIFSCLFSRYLKMMAFQHRYQPP